MLYQPFTHGLETKYSQLAPDESAVANAEISGYASVFGSADQGGDIVQKGAYLASLKRIIAEGRKIKMLWQHDPTQPIGVWDEVREDARGLFVKGRILKELRQGAEALALLKARAIDGLSIGYRTLRAEKTAQGGRLLHELDLWEVSLVTFPMLPQARISDAAPADADLSHSVAEAINAARRQLLA